MVKDTERARAKNNVAPGLERPRARLVDGGLNSIFVECECENKALWELGSRLDSGEGNKEKTHCETTADNSNVGFAVSHSYVRGQK
jgi:hypothetical protein